MATVLVVEDDPALCLLIQRILTRQGLRVSLARDGPAALAIVRRCSRDLDLVLTDAVLPGFDGSMLANHIHAHHPSLAVLFMTGYLDDDLRRFGVSLPADALLRKPFTPIELLDQVRHALPPPVFTGAACAGH